MKKKNTGEIPAKLPGETWWNSNENFMKIFEKKILEKNGDKVRGGFSVSVAGAFCISHF